MPDPIQLQCSKCPRTFRWVPVQRNNSTIKPKPPKEPVCNICKNAEILSQMKGNSIGKRKGFGASKYTVKTKSGKKAIKSPHDRFYKSTAWKWFSRYILLYYSIDGTAAKCCTCGTIKRLNDKELHTGHWIKVFDGNSTNYATAFEFTNLGSQCSKCNRFHGGRERLMAEWLKEQHGPEELDRLQRLSKQAFKLDDYTLDKIAKEYKKKFEDLLYERNYKNPWKK